MNPRHSHRALLWSCITLSTLLHVVVLFTMIDPRQDGTAMPNALSVVLRTDRAEPPHSAEPWERPKARETGETQYDARPPADTALPTVMRHPPVRPPDQPPPDNKVVMPQQTGLSLANARETEERAFDEEALRVALRRAIRPHLNYPPLARRRGWQGTVRVRLRFGADGQIATADLAGSSGYSVLDRAALRALRRIAQLPGELSVAAGRELLLPIEYRLLPDRDHG